MAERSPKQATVRNEEYTSTVVGAETGQSANVGTDAGQYADKDYYIDKAGKVTTKPPEQGKLLVAKGDSVTPRIAALLKK